MDRCVAASQRIGADDGRAAPAGAAQRRKASREGHRHPGTSETCRGLRDQIELARVSRWRRSVPSACLPRQRSELEDGANPAARTNAEQFDWISERTSAIIAKRGAILRWHDQSPFSSARAVAASTAGGTAGAKAVARGTRSSRKRHPRPSAKAARFRCARAGPSRLKASAGPPRRRRACNPASANSTVSPAAVSCADRRCCWAANLASANPRC